MIDVLNRITELREERNWSEYQLAEKSGLTQSTISTWYRKNMFPTLPSLVKICNAFGISLSQFFMDASDVAIPLNQQQIRLLEYTARLTSDQQDALVDFLQKMEKK